MKKLTLVAALTAVLLGGCDAIGAKQNKVDCSNKAGLETLKTLITEQAEKELKQAEHSGAAIRATLNKLTLSIEEIRTSKTDPDSTKVFCDASLFLTLPTDFYEDVKVALDAAESGETIEDILESHDYQPSKTAANAFYTQISYELQPTDDGKQIFARTDSAAASAISTLAQWSLYKKDILKAAAQAKRAAKEETPPSTEEEPSTENTSSEVSQASQSEQKAQLEHAKKAYKQSVARINATYNALSKESQELLRDEQIAFNKEREANCKSSSLQIDGSDIEQEIYRYECAAEALDKRNEELMNFE